MEPFELAENNGQPDVLLIRGWMDKIAGLSAGFTTRSSLNCALHVGDDPADVIANRQRVSRAAGFDFTAWTCAEQTHGKAVRIVSAADIGAGRMSREDAFADTDAMATDLPGVMLTAFYADCVPLYFVDPVRRVVGISHAGWKGTAANIAAHTIDAMKDSFGSKPEQLLAVIGPSIGSCCYEVDERVVGQIDVCQPERKDNGRYMLDLKEANRQFMIRAGIKPNNIERSGYCTCCRTELFFSFRGENGRTGRMAAWIGWRDEVNR